MKSDRRLNTKVRIGCGCQEVRRGAPRQGQMTDAGAESWKHRGWYDLIKRGTPLYTSNRLENTRMDDEDDAGCR